MSLILFAELLAAAGLYGIAGALIRRAIREHRIAVRLGIWP